MKSIKIIGETATHWHNYVFLHPLLYMLKTYHDHFGKSKDDYRWLRYNQNIKNDKNVDNLAIEILKENIDLICFSVYVWGNIFLNNLAKKIKQLKPNIILIMGGPDITARTDPDWFKINSHVDYVIYGDGEKAFSLLLDYFAGHDIKIENIPNLIYQRNEKKIINEFEVLRNKEYFAISPWQYCIDFFEEDLKYFIEELNQNIIILWERIRGCPYSCSFCDWSSGLHNKVSKKTYNFKKDIDLIYNLSKKFKTKLSMYIIDANVGMFEEDYEIFKYVYENPEISNNVSFDFQTLNWSKNHKDRVYKIWDLILNKTNINYFKISQQDVHEDILKNTNRPSIPWNNIKQYVFSRKNYFENHNEIVTNVYPTIELMAGLPGQTKDSWYQTIIECAKIGMFNSIVHAWVMLPYTPANNLEYQEKYKIKVTKTYTPETKFKTFNSRSEILNNFLDSDKSIFKNEISKSISFFNMVTETYSYNLEDLIFFHLTSSFYNRIVSEVRNVSKIKIFDFIPECENILLKQRPKLEKLAKEHCEIIKEDLNKYGYIFFAVENDFKYYDHYRNWFFIKKDDDCKESHRPIG